MIDRFKTLLEKLSLSPSEFADRIGVQRSNISHILSGRNKPSIDFLEKILLTFPDTDVNWLITGKVHSLDALNISADVIKEKSIEPVEVQNIPQSEIKTPVPFVKEPVDKIILVYNNNTFRILNPSDR